MSNSSGIKIYKRLVLIISIVLFAASLTQDFIDIGSTSGEPGLGALIFGWLGIVILNPPALTWLANPLLFVAWKYFIKDKTALSTVLSAGASILSVCFLSFNSIVDNEGGTSQHITGIRIGYWLWLSSIVTFLIGNLIMYLLRKPNSSQNIKVINQS